MMHFMKEMKLGETMRMAKDRATPTSDEAWLEQRRLDFHRIMKECVPDSVKIQEPIFSLYEDEILFSWYVVEKNEFCFSRNCLRFSTKDIDGLLRRGITYLLRDRVIAEIKQRDYLGIILPLLASLLKVPKSFSFEPDESNEERL